MSNFLNSSSRPSAARRAGRQTSGLSLLAAAGVLFGGILGGCSQEQRENWTWNPFEKKSKTTAPDAGTKARRPAPPPPPATASNTPQNNAKPTADDQKAEQVNRDVGNYASSFPNKNNTRPSQTNSRTPAIDDDQSLAEASPPPRAARTSARPAPSSPSAAPPPTTPTNSMGDELVLMPADSNTSAADAGHSTSAHPDSNSIAMASAGDNRQPTHSDPDPIFSSHPATTEDEPEANARPPVLGSVAIEAGADTEAHARVDDNAMRDIEYTDPTGIKPTPIRPIDMDRPVNSSDATPAKPATSEISPPVKSTPPPAAKTVVEQPKPKPESSTVEPFEDREDAPPPVKPASVKPQPVSPAPIEPKSEDNPKASIPPAIATPPTPTPAPPPSANENNRPIESTARQIADLEAIVARQPNNIDQQLKLRMRYLEQGDEARALKPTPGMSEDIERTVINQIKSVIAAKSADGRTAPEAANKQLESAEAIRTGAAAKADLLVPRVALCTAIRAFGDYTPIEPPTFPAGRNNRVLVYIEVENFMSKQTDDGQYKTVLSLRESLLDARGRELWAQQNPPVEDISRQRRRDFFLTTGERPISAKLPPGEYFYKVEVEDMQASKINSAKTQFKLVAVGKN